MVEVETTFVLNDWARDYSSCLMHFDVCIRSTEPTTTEHIVVKRLIIIASAVGLFAGCVTAKSGDANNGTSGPATVNIDKDLDKETDVDTTLDASGNDVTVGTKREAKDDK